MGREREEEKGRVHKCPPPPPPPPGFCFIGCLVGTFLEAAEALLVCGKAQGVECVV